MAEADIRLLYIDDDEALVRLVQRILRRRGFEVIHATNGDEALRYLAEGNIDVVALDHYLPTGTGLDLLARLSENTHAPAVVYVTGSAEMDIAVAALKAGASDFVPKTVGEDFFTLLTSALEQAVEKTRLQTQKEEAEREVRAARDRAEVLLHEVNHRVANSLSLVSSLVGLQANAVKDQVAKDALSETQARIYAISLVHKRLYTSGDARFVEIDEYLAGLIEHLRASMTAESHGAKLVTEVEHLQIPTDAAIALGVVVTELVTNAIKYAFLEGEPQGEIKIRLVRVDDQLELTVSDDGIGWCGEGSVKGTGLGTRIVRAMANSLDATIDYIRLPKGTAAKMRFPLSQK
ncbi:MAG TPA: response regulator [Rhizobiaceae bacterium]|nr:response regulator [Rhizobiaceae bacterium]